MRAVLNFSFILLILALSSCHNRDNSNSTTDSTNLSSHKPITLSNGYNKFDASSTGAADPYFVESTDTVSSHGPYSITRNIHQDKNGKIWLASWQGIICYDTSSKLFTNVTLKEGLQHFHVFSILETKNGDLWFGTIGGGVIRYSENRFVNFKAIDGLAGDNIESMMEDKDGNIWFGTDDGVSRFSAKSFTSFTTNDGLCGNSVNAITQDVSGKIWFGTDKGVSVYDGKTFSDFKNKNGLPFHNVRSMITDHNGNTWIGGADGLVRYDGKTQTTVVSNFIGYVYEDHKNNLWLSASGTPFSGVVQSVQSFMTLFRYDPAANISSSGTPLQTMLEKTDPDDRQVFGVTEDAEGNIWVGTMKGVMRYDGVSFNLL
jgi:ligand-binding sensor domain-containing protein